MAIEAFNPLLLQNSAFLARFLEGSEEAAAIVCAGSNASGRLAGRWEVSYLSNFKEVYFQLTALVLYATSYLSYGLCMTDLSKRLRVWAQHEQSNARVIAAVRVFQNNLLGFSINTYRKNISDFYLQPPLQIALPGLTEASRFNFFSENGVCRGMSHWFVYLFFKTLNQFSNPEQHLCALSTQFEHGASKQAAFLHSLNQSRDMMLMMYGLLNLNVQEDYLSADPQNLEQLRQELQLCPPGVYGIYIGNHQLAYIKYQSSHQQFLFDPNYGIFKIDSSPLFIKGLERYFGNHDLADPIFVDRYYLH